MPTETVKTHKTGLPIRAWIDPDLKAQIEEICEAEDRTESALFRAALKRYVAAHRAKEMPMQKNEVAPVGL